MNTTLTGENSFAWSEALHELTNNFEKEYGELSLERLDGEEVDYISMQQSLTSLPFFANRKLIILRSPGKNKQFAEKFEQLLSTVPSTTDVIIVEPKLDKRLSYYKFLKKQTDFREFQELDDSSLIRWLSMAAKEQDGSIESRDARYLIDRVGHNQLLLMQELNKLLLYNTDITRHTIDLLTDPVPQSTIFQLLEAAFLGRTKEMLNLYQEQRALKVEPQQIIALLTWQLHIMAIIKTAGDRSADQIAQESGINSYVIRKSQPITSRLNLSELRERVTELADIDKRLKNSLINPDEALQYYLLSLKA